MFALVTARCFDYLGLLRTPEASEGGQDSCEVRLPYEVAHPRHESPGGMWPELIGMRGVVSCCMDVQSWTMDVAYE